MFIHDPSGTAPFQTTEAATLAPRVRDLRAVEIGFLDNLKPGGAQLLAAVRDRFQTEMQLRTSYWEKTGREGSSGPLAFGEKMAEQVGAVVNALGD